MQDFFHQQYVKSLAKGTGSRWVLQLPGSFEPIAAIQACRRACGIVVSSPESIKCLDWYGKAWCGKGISNFKPCLLRSVFGASLSDFSYFRLWGFFSGGCTAFFQFYALRTSHVGCTNSCTNSCPGFTAAGLPQVYAAEVYRTTSWIGEYRFFHAGTRWDWRCGWIFVIFVILFLWNDDSSLH